MTNDEELLSTIEEIRKQQFAELPTDLVKEIVLIERTLTDNRPEAFRRIGQAIDAYLEKVISTTEAGG